MKVNLNDIKDRFPIGYVTINNDLKDAKYISFKRFLDAQSAEQNQMNKDIKKLLNINYPCSLFYVDTTKEKDGLQSVKEGNLYVIPKNNNGGYNPNTVSAYIRARMKGKPDVIGIDGVEIFEVRNDLTTRKTTVGELLKKLSKEKGFKLEEPEDTLENKRNKTYPVYRYKNYSRRSGVYAYAYSSDHSVIYVYFTGKDRAWYKYDVKSGPNWVIWEMIRRAKKGWGLNRFINKHPKTYYWKGKY